MSPDTRRLVALSIAGALVPLNSTMIAVAIPTMARDLGRDVATLTAWLVTSYLVVGIVFQNPAGKLGDRIGHARLLVFGQAIFVAGATLGWLAHSIALLAAARVAMGIGGAIIVPSAMAIVRLSIAEQARGRAFGTFGAAMALAAAIGPVIGGELTRRFGWRAVFFANAPLLLLSALLAGSTRLPAHARRPARFDVVGSIALGASLSAIAVGTKVQGARGLALSAIGVVGVVAFLAWEKRVDDPVVDPALFRSGPFAAGASIVALQNLAMYALLFELPSHLSAARGTDSATAGRTLFGMMAAMVVGSPLGGRLAERIGARTTVTLGSLSSFLGLAILALLADRGPLALAPPLALFGFGLGVSSAPSQAAALSAVDEDKSGMAAAALSTMRYLGGVVGIAALSLVLARGGTAVARHRLTMEVLAVPLFVALIAARGLPSRAVQRGAHRMAE